MIEDNLKTVVHDTMRTAEDISLPTALAWLRERQQEIDALQCNARNARIRLWEDKYDDHDDVERAVSYIEILYEREYTAEEQEKTRIFLATRKAERKAAARVQFDRLRERYGW